MSYQTITTNIGLAKIAAAIANGETISLSAMKLGDGNGNPVAPSATQTDLVRTVFTGAPSTLEIDSEIPNRLIAELVVPSTVGGWTIREVGLYDSDGALIIVANFPEVYKPVPVDGASRELLIRVVVELANPEVFSLVVDPNIIVATRKWVVDNFSLAALLPGGTTFQILRKKSNLDGDTEWVDPATSQNIIVNVIEENQTLASGQTIVNLVAANTTSIAVYVEGVRLRKTQFSINSATQFTLGQSYPAGSRITICQNEPNGQLGQATTESAGIIELATDAEVQVGTDPIRAVTPASLASRTATETRTGVVELATTAETQTGTDAVRAVTPAALSNRTATETRTGLAEIATTAEVSAGTDDQRIVTPLKLAQRLLAIPSYSQATETSIGLVELATNAETQAGTDTIRAVTPASAASAFVKKSGDTMTGALTNASGFIGPVTGNASSASSLQTSRSIVISGDATGSALFNGSADATIVATLSNSGVTAGTYNNNSAGVRPFTVDAKGRVTAIGAEVPIRQASDLQAGLVELATDAETQAGTDATRAVTPASLASRTATDLRTGLVELATNAETQAGTDATRAVTPANLKSAFSTAKAWGVYDGVSNTLLSDYNILSITKTATGRYTVQFDEPFANVNYCAVVGGGDNKLEVSARTTSSLSLIQLVGSTYNDNNYICFAIFS